MTSLQPCIQTHIIVLREQRVMIDADLAELYGVVTKVLVQAVKRNLTRFPPDFMFQLSTQEWAQDAVAGAPRPMPSPNRAWPCCRRFWAARAPSG